MPRSRPARLRSAVQHPPTAIRGVPLATTRALDRLGRSDLGSAQVREALDRWRRTATSSRATLAAPHSDWTELIGPEARDRLERALHALPRRHAAALRAVVAPLDDAFRTRTLHNPGADPSAPWWARRWSP